MAPSNVALAPAGSSQVWNQFYLMNHSSGIGGSSSSCAYANKPPLQPSSNNPAVANRTNTASVVAVMDANRKNSGPDSDDDDHADAGNQDKDINKGKILLVDGVQVRLGGNMDAESFDSRKLKRIISNRASAQKSRLKKVQYVMEMEKKAKTLESQIAFLSPQVEFYTHQKQFLQMEQKSLNGKITAYNNDKIQKDAEIEATKKEVARLRELLDQKANIQAGANASSRMVNQKDAGLMVPTPGFNQSGPGKMGFSNSEKVGESSSEANKLKQVTVAQEEQQNQNQPVGLTTMAGQEPARSDQSVPQQKDKNKMNSEDGDQEMKDVMNFNEQKQ
ncbi:basic leucine zipper 61-like [Pyrus communis]|uniref:basic leucine zipper 61-like n=1 Tax=Pyrus communis TaxID=23211 RepID=UPI0035BFEBA9